MRSKEEAHDYRYFPEPDQVPIVLSEDYVRKIKDQLPELPTAKRARFVSQFGLPDYDAGVLTGEKEMADWFEAGAKMAKNPKGLANWIMGDMAAQMKEQEKELKDLKFDQKKLCELVELVDAGSINSMQAKEVFLELFNNGTSPIEVVKTRGVAQVSDPKPFEGAVDKLLAENPSVVADYKGGKQGVIGFLVGKVMKVSQGKANPVMLNFIFKAKLENAKARLKLEMRTSSLSTDLEVLFSIQDQSREDFASSEVEFLSIIVLPNNKKLPLKKFLVIELDGEYRPIDHSKSMERNYDWVLGVGKKLNNLPL